MIDLQIFVRRNGVSDKIAFHGKRFASCAFFIWKLWQSHPVSRIHVVYFGVCGFPMSA